VEDLLHNKARKNLVTLGASLFNGKPKSGIAFLEENGVIYAEHGDEVSRPQSLARFLKSSTRLDKKLLGDYISKPENLELLKAFISLFDYKDVSSSTSRT
jgi:brefeldin A-resistance guanine nucleotide exchange factor 1